MNTTRATLEIIAPTVEEAVEKGLSDLGLSRDLVEVEVLDAGARGLFGLGTRQARIRLSVKSSPSMDVVPVAPPPPPAGKAAPRADAEKPAVVVEQVVAEPEEPVENPDEDDVLRISREIVTELLEKMKVQARVTAHYGELDDPKGRVPVLVDVRGDDLSILIGKRAETLNALQYIASLIVCKELERSISLVIDIEGYRSRRSGQIRQLARRMAEQAIKTGRRQILEPMPASERRLVHLELRDSPYVTTESVGDEPHRKVTIIPKE